LFSIKIDKDDSQAKEISTIG